ncbi:MAG TPA: NAD(P)H-dependent oxidoreductase subunit E [Dehalococcoidales bacterium]|nr:NAD(P)H-dependent oxidoreductase subunit E [Dehalococcoidales bacterium]
MKKTGRNGERGKLLVLLEAAQVKSAHISHDTITELAESLDLSIGEVYGVASFYSFLYTKPKGRHIIRICKSLPCLLKHSRTIIDSVQKEIGIQPGETTPDGRFSFELTNCIGACDKAPAMMVNSDVHGDLTPKKIARILQGYK